MSGGLRSYLAGQTGGQKALKFLSAFREVKALALAVTLTNIGGVAYGVYYYWDQLLETDWYLLPFVPDSPAGPFLMIIIFALWWFQDGRRSATLEVLAFCLLVKYGIWTLVMFWLYASYFFAPQAAPLSHTLLWLHLGEALEAGILLKGMRWPRMDLAGIVLAWMLLGDFSDYVLGTHPRLPVSAPEFVVVPFLTVALTFISFLVALRWCRTVAARGAVRSDAPRAANEEGPGS